MAQSPNLISFLSILSKLEYYFSLIGDCEVKIIFDYSRQYNLSFSNFFEKLKKAQKLAILQEDKVPLILGYNYLKKFSYEKSENNAFLQIADLFATGLMKLFYDILLNDSSKIYTEFEQLLLGLTFITWHDYQNLFCDMLMSNNLLLKFHKVVKKVSNNLDL